MERRDSTAPWVNYFARAAYACLALQNWHGMVTVVAVLAVTVLCFVTDFFGVRRSWQPMAIVAAGVVTVIATGTLCWRLAGSPAAVRVAEVRVHDWPQMAALATVAGAWRERELARGSFDPDSFPSALDQRSGPGLQLAAALGLALLGVGCAAVFRAHRQSVASAGAGQRPPTEGGGRATTGDRP
jgi:hypothetical protein